MCFDEPTSSELKSKFQSRLEPWSPESSDGLCLVLTEQSTGENIGITGFSLQDKTAEVGFMLLPQYQGLGYATESLIAVLEYSKLNLGINDFRAVVTEGNVGSERVLVKSGFTLENVVPEAYEIGGKLYADHVYYMGNIVT